MFKGSQMYYILTQLAKTLHLSYTHIVSTHDKCFVMVSYAIKNL